MNVRSVQYYAREFCGNAFIHSRRCRKLGSKIRILDRFSKNKEGDRGEAKYVQIYNIAVENNGSERALAADPTTL